MAGFSFGIEGVDQVAADTWMIVGKKGVSAFSWGELVRAVVQQDSSRGVAVHILTQRRLVTNIIARGDWSQQILGQVDLILGQAKPDSSTHSPQL